MTATTPNPHGADAPTHSAHAGDGAWVAPSTERGSTNATAAILQALAAAPDATATGLAETTGLGRSTVTKVLAGLAERGEAIRTSGGRDGRHRPPDRWNLPDQPASEVEPGEPNGPDTDDTPAQAPAEVPAERETPRPVLRAVPDLPGAPVETVPHLHVVPDIRAVAPPADADASQTTSGGGDPEPEPPGDEDNQPDTPRSASEPAGHAGALAPEPEHGSVSAAGQPPATRRLGRGQLRAQVHEHLTARPEAEFTPHDIGRVLGRSAGAVANALAKLTDSGQIVQTSDHPRRYRLAQAPKAQ